MSETLSALFQQSSGEAIDVGGRAAQPIFVMKLGKGRQEFLVRRVKSKNAPVSGLRLKTTKGTIEVNGQQHSEIVLWADTSPQELSIIVSCKSACELKAWNVWRVDDLTQAWVGNAGLVVEEINEGFTLRCSDGVGNVDFDDFVVQIMPKSRQQ